MEAGGAAIRSLRCHALTRSGLVRSSANLCLRLTATPCSCHGCVVATAVGRATWITAHREPVYTWKCGYGVTSSASFAASTCGKKDAGAEAEAGAASALAFWLRRLGRYASRAAVVQATVRSHIKVMRVGSWAWRPSASSHYPSDWSVASLQYRTAV